MDCGPLQSSFNAASPGPPSRPSGVIDCPDRCNVLCLPEAFGGVTDLSTSCTVLRAREDVQVMFPECVSPGASALDGRRWLGVPAPLVLWIAYPDCFGRKVRQTFEKQALPPRDDAQETRIHSLNCFMSRTGLKFSSGRSCCSTCLPAYV